MVAPNSSFDPLVSALSDYAPLSSGLEPHLEAAITQATSEPGKLVRARLAEAGAQANSLDEAEARQLACGVEYLRKFQEEHFEIARRGAESALIAA